MNPGAHASSSPGPFLLNPFRRAVSVSSRMRPGDAYLASAGTGNPNGEAVIRVNLLKCADLFMVREKGITSRAKFCFQVFDIFRF